MCKELTLGANLELKRRKLYDIVGILKPGRSTYFLDRRSFGRLPSSTFSPGIICWSSLQQVRTTATQKIPQPSHGAEGKVDMQSVKEKLGCRKKKEAGEERDKH